MGKSRCRVLGGDVNAIDFVSSYGQHIVEHPFSCKHRRSEETEEPRSTYTSSWQRRAFCIASPYCSLIHRSEAYFGRIAVRRFQFA